MKIPHEVVSKYLTKPDPEAEFFLSYFDEDPKQTVGPTYVLEVGANDNHLALMMAACGFDITGIDLMPYTTWLDTRGYTHVVGDFCTWAASQTPEYDPLYNVIYSVSAIEHFGLGTYNKESYRPYHDVIAMRYIYDLLNPDGVAYITVPLAGKFVELKPHWRTYDYEAVMNRLVQDFNVELFETRVVEWNLSDCGKKPSAGYVAKLTHGEPYVSCLLKLRKGKKDG